MRGSRLERKIYITPYLELYEGEPLLASWSTADEGISIETYATCKDWNISYIFETAGEHFLWYKTTSDGVTEEIPYGEAEPVIINESGVLVAGDFQYKANDDNTGVIITKYMGSDVTVTIPSTVNDLPVVEIAASAFEGNTSINRVIVNGTIGIGSKAFADSLLSELDLPDTLTYIAEDAFDGCDKLTVTVPENCYAYDRCVELGLIKQIKLMEITRISCTITETVYAGCTPMWAVRA